MLAFLKRAWRQLWCDHKLEHIGTWRDTKGHYYLIQHCTKCDKVFEIRE